MLFEDLLQPSIANICGNLNKIIGTNGKQSGLFARLCRNQNDGPINNGYKAKKFVLSANAGGK